MALAKVTRRFALPVYMIFKKMMFKCESEKKISQFLVRFVEPVSAVTPGQVVTLYQDEMVLGGGWIDRAFDDDPS